MNYFSIINQYVPKEHQIIDNIRNDYIYHSDAIRVLSFFISQKRINKSSSLFYIALTGGFIRQLSKSDQHTLRLFHSYDAEILIDYYYSYNLFHHYLHAIVRHFYLNPVANYKTHSSIEKLEFLVLQLDQGIDQTTLAFNQLVGNCPQHEIYCDY